MGELVKLPTASNSADIEEFLKDILKVCKQHNMIILNGPSEGMHVITLDQESGEVLGDDITFHLVPPLFNDRDNPVSDWTANIRKTKNFTLRMDE